MSDSDFVETRVDITDPDETEQHLRDLYGPVALTRGMRLFHQELAGTESVQLHTGRFEGSYRVDIEVAQFVVASAISSCAWEEGRHGGDMALEPVLIRPGVPYVNHFADNENRAVIFDADALQMSARRIYGDPDLVLAFDGPRPATPGSGTVWLSALDLARVHLDAGLLRNDLVRASMLRMLTVTALESFRLRGDRQALRSSAARQ